MFALPTDNFWEMLRIIDTVINCRWNFPNIVWNIFITLFLLTSVGGIGLIS